MPGQKMYRLLECDPSRFDLGGSTEVIGMITLRHYFVGGGPEFQNDFSGPK